MDQHTICSAFEGSRLIASGPLGEVVGPVKRVMEQPDHGPVLIFDDVTAETLELDLRGTLAQVVGRLGGRARRPAPKESEEAQDAGAEVARGPGRPRLGVVAREVTLLPRHWEWLGGQPGGASVTLRKLVEHARRANEGRDRLRVGREALYRFMAVMAGNAPGFEEATRALFAGQRARFESFMRAWPKDVRAHARRMSGAAFDETSGPGDPTGPRRGAGLDEPSGQAPSPARPRSKRDV